MKCYNCGTELIWGGDHDCEDDEEHAIVQIYLVLIVELFI